MGSDGPVAAAWVLVAPSDDLPGTGLDWARSGSGSGSGSCSVRRLATSWLDSSGQLVQCEWPLHGGRSGAERMVNLRGLCGDRRRELATAKARLGLVSIR